jgi:hypothetical protein
MIFSSGGPAFPGQCVSVLYTDLNGFMDAQEVAIGIADSWSISTWIKRTGGSLGDDVFFALAEDGGGAPNRIQINCDVDAAGQLQVLTWDPSGTAIKNQAWNGVTDDDAWVFVVVVWNGTALTVYKDSVDQGAPDVDIADETGTMTDTVREVWMGTRIGGANPFNGNMHSLGVWSVALTQDSVDFLFNSGDASPVDWANDSGAYTQSAGLEHWWRLGFDPDNMGADSGNGTLIVLIPGNGLDSDDIVNDAPGVSCA